MFDLRRLLRTLPIPFSRQRTGRIRKAQSPLTPDPGELSWHAIDKWGPNQVMFPREAEALGLGGQGRARKTAGQRVAEMGKLTPIPTLSALMYSGRANRHWYDAKFEHHRDITAHGQALDHVRHAGLSAVFSPNGPVAGAENATNVAYMAWQHGADLGSGHRIPPRTKSLREATKLMEALFGGFHGGAHFPDSFPLAGHRGKPITLRPVTGKDSKGNPTYSTRTATLNASKASDYVPIGRSMYSDFFTKAAQVLAQPHRFHRANAPDLGLWGDPVKANHYLLSSVGARGYVVTDTHHQQLLNFPAKQGATAKAGMTEAEYHTASLGTRQAADLLNHDSPHKLNPTPDHPRWGTGWRGDNGQSASWAVNQALIKKVREDGASRPAATYLRELTNRDVYQAGDYHHLIKNDPSSREILKLMASSGSAPADIFTRMDATQAKHAPPEHEMDQPAVHPDHINTLTDFVNQVKGRVIRRNKGREKSQKTPTSPALPGFEE